MTSEAELTKSKRKCPLSHVTCRRRLTTMAI